MSLRRLAAAALLMCGWGLLWSQQSASIEEYARRATESIEQERYESALKILEEAKSLYPESPRLNIIAADMYYEQELYGLALGEYVEADRKAPGDQATLIRIARCYGKLSREAEAVATLSRLLEQFPEDIEAIDDLAWMYFKTYRLEEAERLLRQALERFGPDQGLFMTLGTVYSGLYDYASAKRFYEKAIAEARRAGDDYFVSVAWYNLSLLEHNFYHFNSALRATDESLRSAERSSGHLARGELYESRMDFRQAEAEYQKALALDKTQLAKVSLGRLYQIFGRLELARRYGEEVLAAKDLAWIYYYGTDLDRHYKDVHELLADVYRGLARTAVQPRELGAAARFASWVRFLEYRLRAYYHRQKFRLLSLRVGRAHLEQGNRLDAYWEFYKGNEAYRGVGLKYLALAREIETRVAPHSEAHYLYEEGRVRRDPEPLRKALAAMDAFWEKKAIADALIGLAPLLNRSGAERRQALERLFGINPGAFRQNGLKLPLSVQAESSGVLIERLMRLLRAGIETNSEARYRLDLEEEPQRLRLRITDSVTGRTLADTSVALGRGSRRRRALLCRTAILDALYGSGVGSP